MLDQFGPTRLFRFLSFAIIAQVGIVGCTPDQSNEPPKPKSETSLEQRFELVSEGQALAKIVLPTDATPRNREAAQELADAIRNISGAEIEITEGSPSDPPERAIWIGLQPGMESLLPGVDLELTQPEEIRIVTSRDHLLLAGRDKYDPENMTVQGRSKVIEGKQWEYGTANAVYTFIQDSLNVRWLFPGPLGTDYVTTPNITIPATDLRYHPQFRLRMGIFVPHDEGKEKANAATTTWARRHRLLLDSLDMSGGHAFIDWWDKYSATQPELFALQPDGTRGTHPEKPKWKKICEGEPAVWDIWLKEVDDVLKDNPSETIFNAAANDGWSSGHCTDPRSQAWDPPVTDDMELVLYTYKDGVRLMRPPVSDRYITFANKLGEMLKEKYPDKEFYVSQIAYGETSRAAPVNARPNDNVILVSVSNFLFRGKEEKEEQMKHLDDWTKVADKIIWRPNMSGSSGWHWGTPDVGFDRAAEAMKWVAERGIMGIFVDMVWDHWGTQGPLYYLMAELAWDPNADPDEILQDFCDRAYGPAGETMLTYWRLMEDKRDEIEDLSPTRFRMLDSPRFYTAEFFGTARGLLEKAVAETAGADEKYRQRLALVEAGMDYTEMLVETRAAMQRWEESKGADKEAEALVLANWARTDEMKKTAPEFALSWTRAMRNDVPAATQGRRMFGLHPDLVLTGNKLKEFLAGETGAKDELE